MSNQNQSDQRIVDQTKKWLNKVIVGHDYCPFAKREINNDRVRYHVTHDSEFNRFVEIVIQECARLDQHEEIETTLIILPSNLDDFNSFLDCLALAEAALIAQDYEGIYQIASFHPEYCFQGAELDDAANYTNRSPYPMMHLLREASVQLAIKNHPDVEAIPERNIEFARKQGLEMMKGLLEECMQDEDTES